MCSSVGSGNQAGHAVGWSIDDRNQTMAISWKGQPIPADQHEHLTCYEIDQGACHFPNSLKLAR